MATYIFLQSPSVFFNSIFSGHSISDSAVIEGATDNRLVMATVCADGVSV